MAGEWLAEAAGLLDALEPPHKEKKKATIIALVDARLAGRAVESVWEVTRLATGWEDGQSLRLLKKAAERLALASPAAVARVIEKLGSADEAIVLRAAFGILDRAGVDTAVKGVPPTTNIVLSWGESGEDGDGDNDHDAGTA